MPFALVYWSRDPDGTQHNNGDAFDLHVPVSNETAGNAVGGTTTTYTLAHLGIDNDGTTTGSIFLGTLKLYDFTVPATGAGAPVTNAPLTLTPNGAPPFTIDSATLNQQNGVITINWSSNPGTTTSVLVSYNYSSADQIGVGINGPTSKAAVTNADDNLKQLLDYLRATDDPQNPGHKLLENTDVFITADHGFSAVSRHEVDTSGVNFTTSYSAKFIYKDTSGRQDVNTGFLPGGFVAIDLAHALGLPLFDPDAQITNANSQKVYKPVDPTIPQATAFVNQRPASGDGLIGGTGAIPAVGQPVDAKIVVAANGGSDLIYLPDGTLAERTALAQPIVDFLSKQDYVSGLFADDDFGSIPEALKLSDINLKGSALTPTPAVVVNFRTWATDNSSPASAAQSEVEIADTAFQQEGQGMHGSFGRGDTFNFMAAIGPDFKAGFNDQAPISNADITPTLASVLGFNIPSNDSLKGRVISEALVGGPGSFTVVSGVLKSAPTAIGGVETFLNYQEINGVRYFDAAGFAGKTVGLRTTTAAPGTTPKTILISLDGATPRLADQFIASGAFNVGGNLTGLALLAATGVEAEVNQTVSPSLTAVGHIAIATGSTAANNDIPANTHHLIAGPFASNASGFGGPIGDYDYHNSSEGPLDNTTPTAIPIWIPLQNDGQTVVAATFPGADGVNVTVPGLANSPTIQAPPERTVSYTVPFGEFGGVGGQGFSLTSADFSAAPAGTDADLVTAGHSSFSSVLQKTTPLETFTVGGVSYTIQVAALDTTDDATTNYDTLVFFDISHGGILGPFTAAPLGTGPAYVKASDRVNSRFYIEGSPKNAGTAFYVTTLAPDLSTVRLARYSVNDIPPNAAVLGSVTDANNSVGFWAPQDDFRFPERLNPGLSTFTDPELEAIFENQVKTFVADQTSLALRSIQQNPSADLVMIYIEEPDGSEHQFLINDPRQATDPTNPNTIGAGQDLAKVQRYAGYIQTAYQVANNAVQAVINAVGVNATGKPKSNVIVTSDHGFEEFHTAVSINNFLAAAGFDLSQVRAVTSSPAVNFYINLQGRGPGGTVNPQQYLTLQQRLVTALQAFADTNPNYTLGAPSVHVFDKVYTRPAVLGDANFGHETGPFIGLDSGDVSALLTLG
jgi:predicted AlkP superfamily pyrophosphatase or phosphodiesterase